MPDALAPRTRNAPPTYRHDVGLRRVGNDLVVASHGPNRHAAVFDCVGVAVSERDPAAAEAFLEDLAGLLNALRPSGVQMVARTRPGGFAAHLRERRAAADALALPAARSLALAQLEHYERMAANGDSRALSFVIVVPASTAGRARDAAAATATLCEQVGLRVRRLIEPELSMVLADWWRGDVPTHWYLRLGNVVLNAAPSGAEVRKG